MKQIWQGRLTEATVKYGEHAQMATVCCNACRTCVQTNAIGLGIAALGAGGRWLSRLRWADPLRRRDGVSSGPSR